MKDCGLVSIGDLRTPVTFQRLSIARDNTPVNEGGLVQSWAQLRSTRAQVVAASGREVYAGDRVEARAMYRVTCRYFAELVEADRVLIYGVAYNIRRIVDWEMRRRWLIIDVEKGVAS
jgi:SPP1 family predicted phage head-tail adaptor